MPNTVSNLTSSTDVINQSFRVHVDSDPIRVALSSQEGSMAQLEFTVLNIRRRLLGKKALALEIADRSGIAELLDESPVTMLVLPLGRRAIIGRKNSLGLPLLLSESVSDEHLALTFSESEDGYYFSINDTDSMNGSHLIKGGATERTWRDQINELSAEADAPAHTDSTVDPSSYSFLYDPDVVEYYPGTLPKTTL